MAQVKCVRVSDHVLQLIQLFRCALLRLCTNFPSNTVADVCFVIILRFWGRVGTTDWKDVTAHTFLEAAKAEKTPACYRWASCRSFLSLRRVLRWNWGCKLQYITVFLVRSVHPIIHLSPSLVGGCQAIQLLRLWRELWFVLQMLHKWTG